MKESNGDNMNDKDTKAFEKWFKKNSFDYYGYEKNNQKIGWQAACEFKQKEIDKQKDLIDECEDRLKKSLNFLYDYEKLQAENAKLRECVEWYADEANQIAPIYLHDGRNRPGADFTQPYRMDSGKRARQVLKELE